MRSEKILDRKLPERDNVDYNYPLNSVRYFQDDDGELDISAGFTSQHSKLVNMHISDIRKSRSVISTIVSKYRQRLGDEVLRISDNASLKEYIGIDFGGNEMININDIIMFCDTSCSEDKTYLCLTKDYCFGVDNKNCTYVKSVEDVSHDMCFLKNKFLHGKKANVKEATFELIIKLVTLT